VANEAKKITAVYVANSITSNDSFLIVRSYANSSAAQTAMVPQTVLITGKFINSEPANNAALTITQGDYRVSNSYLYVATANNYVKRVSLTDF